MGLKEERIANELTQKDLVEAIKADGVPMDAIVMSRIETGTSFPTPAQAIAISRHLQAPLSRLFPRIEEFIVGDTERLKTGEKQLRYAALGFYLAAEKLHEG